MKYFLKARKGQQVSGSKYSKRIPKKGTGYRYFYSKEKYHEYLSKQDKPKKETKGLDSNKEKKSTESPYYYQVPVKVAKKTMWKKYKTYNEYRSEYPNGPEKGHILINQSHPAHLRIDKNAWFAKIGNKIYMNKKSFLADNPIPSKYKAKEIVQKNIDMQENRGKGVDYTLIPNFTNKEWHPSWENKLNADQRKFLGVEGQYRIYRDAIIMMYDKERYQREGKKWSIVDYKKRLTKEEAGYVPEKKREGKPEKKPRGTMRKGTNVKFTNRGKVTYGKVIGTKSIGAKGKEVQKAVTHYNVEFDLASKKNHPASSLKKVKSKIQTRWIKKDEVEREKPSRTYRGKLKQDDAEKEREEKNIAKKLDRAKKRLMARNDIEFQTKVLDIMGGENGLKDPKNPLNIIISKRINSIVNNMYERGIDPYQNLSRDELHEAGLSGVFESILDWNEKKSKLTTFLESNLAKDYIKNSINNALYTERQQFHRMSPDYKLALFKFKQIKENLKKDKEKEPSTKEIIDEYRSVYGKKIGESTLKKFALMLRNQRVSNVIENTDAEGQLDLIDNINSHYKTPEEIYLEKEKMETFHSAITRLLPEKKERQALLLRFRIDETTTGKGMYGQESKYYTEKANDVSQYEGKTKIGKTPEYRNYSEIAKLLNLKTSVEAQRYVEGAIRKIKEEHEKGNEDVQELENIMMNKSFEQKRDFIRLYLFKSIFPEKRDTWIEKQLINAQMMLKSILVA